MPSCTGLSGQQVAARWLLIVAVQYSCESWLVDTGSIGAPMLEWNDFCSFAFFFPLPPRPGGASAFPSVVAPFLGLFSGTQRCGLQPRRKCIIRGGRQAVYRPGDESRAISAPSSFGHRLDTEHSLLSEPRTEGLFGSRGLLAAGAKARHAKPRSRGPSWARDGRGEGQVLGRDEP